MSNNEPDIVKRLRNYNTCSDTDVDEAADTIEELTSHIEDLVTKCEQLQHERDEARKRLSECAMDKIAELDKEMGL